METEALVEFKNVRERPASLKPGAIERALEAFLTDSRVEGVDLDGLYYQLVEAVTNILLFKNAPYAQFWLAEEDGEVVAWALTHVSKGVDSKLVFYMTDAWVDKKYRGTKAVKQWYKTLEDEAKKLMCKHMVVVSSRGDNAYCRFLGAGWSPYAALLKKDI